MSEGKGSDPTPGNESVEFFDLPSGRMRLGGAPLFDTVELWPAVEHPEGYCESFDSVEEIPEDLRDAVFWTLFGHTPGEGVQAIGDFRTREAALEVFHRLFGDWPLA